MGNHLKTFVRGVIEIWEEWGSRRSSFSGKGTAQLTHFKFYPQFALGIGFSLRQLYFCKEAKTLKLKGPRGPLYIQICSFLGDGTQSIC